MLSALLSALALLLQRSTLAAAVAARIAVNRRHIDSRAPALRPRGAVLWFLVVLLMLL